MDIMVENLQIRAIIKKTISNKCPQGYRARQLSYTAGRNVNQYGSVSSRKLGIELSCDLFILLLLWEYTLEYVTEKLQINTLMLW